VVAKKEVATSNSSEITVNNQRRSNDMATKEKNTGYRHILQEIFLEHPEALRELVRTSISVLLKAEQEEEGKEGVYYGEQIVFCILLPFPMKFRKAESDKTFEITS
jgi:hypothetical protein